MIPCTHCEREFCDEAAFDQHRTAYHNIRIKCMAPGCHEKFVLRVALQSHQKEVHLEPAPFICVYCRESFTSKGELQCHLEQNHEFQCPRCQRVLPNREALDQHRAAAHSMFYNCRGCKERFVLLQILRKHEKEFHSEDCSHFSVSFGTKDELEAHAKVEHTANHLSCTQCRLTFDTDALLQAHDCKQQNNSHLPNNTASESITSPSPYTEHPVQSPQAPTHICEECSAIFVTQMALDLHIVSAHTFICTCGEKYKTAGLLAEHQSAQHSYQCNKCPSRLNTFEEFLKHVEEHHEIKCNKCPAIFDSTENLTKHHLTTHAFMCEKCPQHVFDSAGQLFSHKIRAHHFKCTRCPGAAFEDEEALEYHQTSTHKTECPLCREDFDNTFVLMKHLFKTHYIKCQDCGGLFGNDNEYYNHRNTAHQSNSPIEPSSDESFVSAAIPTPIDFNNYSLLY